MLLLPVEILEPILRNLYCIDKHWKAHGRKNDLLAARAVCKRPADVATRLAFQHITVLQDPQGFRKLRDVSKSDLRNCEQSLTYCFEDFNDETDSKEEFLEGFIAERYTPPRESLYEDYRSGSLYQFDVHSYNLDVAHLAAAFTMLENLQSVRISQVFTDRSGPWFERKFYPLLVPDFFELPTSCRVLDTIATSLAAADTKLKSLILVSSKHYDVESLPLTGLIQVLSISKFSLYREAFGHLKALTIRLPECTVEGETNFEGLSDFVRSLPALEELVFTGTDAPSGPITNLLLTDLRFSSRLHYVEMSYITFRSVADLTGFFRQHSESLRRVKLHSVGLHDGSWEEVFSHMRGMLTLSSCEMSGNFSISCEKSGRKVEIGYGMPFHGDERVLQDRNIEHFIEGATDAAPFDLLRAYEQKYPKHILVDDFLQWAVTSTVLKYS